MSGLSYVGRVPANPKDVEIRSRLETQFASGVSREYVADRVDDLSALRATKVYTDTRDETFAPAPYYVAQDALLVPNAAKAAPSGVATLDGSGKVPAAQVPYLGAGILKGPFAPTTSFGGNTFQTPIKVLEWNIGMTAISCQPLVFVSTGVLSVGGRSVIEVRVGDPSQTTYASQTLVAQGFGKSYYNDYQLVSVLSADPDLSEGQDGVQDFLPPTLDMRMTAWLYDDGGGQSTITLGLVYSAAIFLARTSL